MTYESQTEAEVLARLGQFVKPSCMPVTAKQIDAWESEAMENDGYVEVPAHQTLSGRTELFRL